MLHFNQEYLVNRKVLVGIVAYLCNKKFVMWIEPGKFVFTKEELNSYLGGVYKNRYLALGPDCFMVIMEENQGCVCNEMAEYLAMPFYPDKIYGPVILASSKELGIERLSFEFFDSIGVFCQLYSQEACLSFGRFIQPTTIKPGEWREHEICAQTKVEFDYLKLRGLVRHPLVTLAYPGRNN
jgi:hypothetical protein